MTLTLFSTKLSYNFLSIKREKNKGKTSVSENCVIYGFFTDVIVYKLILSCDWVHESDSSFPKILSKFELIYLQIQNFEKLNFTIIATLNCCNKAIHVKSSFDWCYIEINQDRISHLSLRFRSVEWPWLFLNSQVP